VAGGKDRLFRLGDYSGIASGVRIFCSSNDYVNELVTIGLESGVAGDVIFEQYTGIGANSVVLPSNVIPEGTVIGALSFVPANFKFEPWSVYFGNPLRYIMPRNREAVMRQVESLRARR
jgi:acetyltransferase-like isoleucine patch superfamily enzyme